MKTVDVVIIGAGPAGSVCGYLLKKAGMDCLLVDHASFPRDKVCGGGLTPKAWHLLERLMPRLQYSYQPIDHISLFFENVYQGDLHITSEERMIRIVQRKEFDDLLLRRYKEAGGNFLKGAFVGFTEDKSSLDYPVTVTLRSGEQFACRYLVGADGAVSQVRRQIAPDSSNGILSLEQYQALPANREQKITIGMSRKFKHGYFYVFPNNLHNVVGFCDMKVDRFRFQSVALEQGYPLDSDLRIRGAFIPRRCVVSPSSRIILIGDAGGFPNRVSYEGLYYAFATAENACRAITEGKDFRRVNKIIFRKKRKEDFLDWLVYSRFGLYVIKRIAHHPGFLSKCYNFFV